MRLDVITQRAHPAQSLKRLPQLNYIMNQKHVVIDPIHGKIEMPQWLIRIKDRAPIRRMMNIKQLGLKAFIDFPGAIHTRYLHSLGTMFLAGKLTDLLIKKEESRSSARAALKENLKNNRNSLMAAGFFHDIGHGPYSHVMDYVLESEFKLNHELITTKVVKRFTAELEDDSIPINHVNKIITRKHRYPFLWGMINGPLDVDKVDYVLRDSYHVGLRYSFDLDHFFDQMAILGADDELERCELGLEKDLKAIVCAELFLLLWKSMYDLVYLVQSSRIAEKMLEKAILCAVRTGCSIKDEIIDLDKYLELDESKLADELIKCGGYPKDVSIMLETADLYIPVFNQELAVFNTNTKFVRDVQKTEDKVSDKISQRLSNLSSKPYSIICDIVKTKVPKDIHIDEKDVNGEPYEIKQKSEISRAIAQPKIFLKVYIHPTLRQDKKFLREKFIKIKTQSIIDGW